MALKSVLLATVVLTLSTAPVMAEEAATPGAVKAETKKEVAKKEVAKKEVDYTILSVGDEKIPYSDVQAVWDELFAQGGAPEFSTFDETIRQNVLRGVVSEKLLYKEALKAGVDKRDEIEKRLKNVKKQLIIQAFVEEKANALISDESLKQAYDKYVAEAKGKEEIRARHILVDSEEKAKKITKKVKDGEDFAKLAKSESIDKTSALRGGDLDYFTADKMVPEFSEAAYKLKKGEVSDPVKSSFGWHIIRVEDRRPVKVPGFEQMKDQLAADMRRKGIEQYVEGLLKDANIKYYDAKGKELKFDIHPPKDKE